MTTRDVDTLLTNPDVIRNRRKLEATISNALAARRLIRTHSSLQGYLDTLLPQAATSQGDLEAAAEILSSTFAHLGQTSALCFLFTAGYRAAYEERRSA